MPYLYQSSIKMRQRVLRAILEIYKYTFPFTLLLQALLLSTIYLFSLSIPQFYSIARYTHIMRTQPPAPPSQMPSSSSTDAVDVDVDVSIWRAVAGPAVNVPAVNSYVYYFPQGHLEQWSPSNAAANFNFNLSLPSIPCQVISNRYLTDRTSDRVMARIHLQPLHPFGPPPSRDGNSDEDDDGDIVSFVKVLTRSDANNGGGFSVPRFCADMILPELNFKADPPVQNLVLKDTRGNSWEFRHIYRGTPRRHLLTTGWSKFVNAKSLVAGDSVVFMKKKSTKKLFVGIRRADKVIGDGKEVAAAMESAAKGMAFEVVYYPKVDIPDFVVMAEKVNKAIQMRWGVGMRVRMAVESGEAWRMTWIEGVVTAISAPEGVLWGSPWRILQVSWDLPEVEATYNVKKVNPWQVEYEPLINPDLPSPKRFKLLQDPTSEFTVDDSLAVNLNNSSSLIYYSPFSDGIRGARHTFNPSTTNTAQHGAPGPQHSNAPISTVLSIGSSYSDIVSPVSQKIVHLESGGGGAGLSFKLFGKTIHAVARYGGGEGGDDGGSGGGERSEGNI